MASLYKCLVLFLLSSILCLLNCPEGTNGFIVVIRTTAAAARAARPMMMSPMLATAGLSLVGRIILKGLSFAKRQVLRSTTRTSNTSQQPAGPAEPAELADLVEPVEPSELDVVKLIAGLLQDNLDSTEDLARI